LSREICLISIIILNRTKEIGESSKTILQKKTNKSSNQRSSITTLNKKRISINQEDHLSPTRINQSSPADRPLRFTIIFFLFFSFQF
jgi:negative regulator of replication initiation